MASIRIGEISRPGPDSSTKKESISNVKHLSSYNWIEADASTPTIAVPGSPALWTPPSALQHQVKKDSGFIYIAQNAARHPESPLEPLFRALYLTKPTFDITSVSLVTDRNNIRKLLSFVNPKLARFGLEPFTIEVEVVNNTAIFCRSETKTHEIIAAHEFIRYGHEFEKAYTTEQVDGSTGHHRIISYQLGDMKLVVRYETDGCIATSLEKTSAAIKPRASVNNENIAGMLKSLSLSSANKPTYAGSYKSALKIKEEGRVVPIESTLEIRTRTYKKLIEVDEVLPQMWLSQTPNLSRAYHRNGSFERPTVENIAENLIAWEDAHQADIKNLVAVIRRIISAVKECGAGAVVKYDAELDKLVVWRGENKERMLPEDIYSKFEVIEQARLLREV
ncbi:hypothetical protein BJY04DRAFT_212936 [Aspergillus karnatakaensis]|uniref:uncharacterized protein n=1 Tax=Aspergillus karnatakaensis TaxID=1810916 RepID=UPI003CCD000F